MRLTSVTRMTLPVGTLHSFVVRDTGDRGARVPVSFDQRRHVGEGQRPASWMAVAFRVPGDIDRELLGAAWMRVLARHGTFRTAFDLDGDGVLSLHEIELAAVGWTQHPVDGETRDAVRAVFDVACAPFERPSHRLSLLEPDDPADGAPIAIIGSDHAHVDMLSWHVVVRDLLAAAADLRDGRDEIPPAPAFAEHTAVLEAMAPAPAEVAERWAQILAAENGAMPIFPLPLGDVSSPRPAVVDVREVLDAEGITGFDAAAAAAGVRAIVLAIAVLTAVTRDLARRPLRAVFPVHSRHEQRWHDAVGWFITNAVLESGDPDPAACAVAVREAIALGSHPLAPILAPYGGMPARPGMFALSWLDGRRLPVPDPPGLELQHVSAAVRVDGVMVWFTASPEGLQVRCRYPDTDEARQNVGAWLDAVVDAMRLAAAS
jgi:hypothetical protein